ncbi:hypothetical protein M0813_05273 [Anaeramoeba flamelloides]|uniref:Uncharacterized protein n=1 Tax=Anaeramoeba flamelloides TaxID=1746091 RepID=A0ABQ8XHK0_9EUKA|nr:hypothetical protein M0813_05273 [Anaeramoeba flamelloides]
MRPRFRKLGNNFDVLIDNKYHLINDWRCLEKEKERKKENVIKERKEEKERTERKEKESKQKERTERREKESK